MNIAEKFKELRLKKGWTQEEVAEKIFVSPKTISSWECGNRLMDTDAIESLCRLYGYELQREDKVEKSVVSIRDILNSPTLSLSAKDVVGNQKATIRADIANRVKKESRELSEKRKIDFDKYIEDALSYYNDYIKNLDNFKKADNMYSVHSDYYEKELTFSETQANVLLNIYRKVAKDNKFIPEAETVYDMVNNPGILETVMYHVEEFGKGNANFSVVEDLFE
ncbi:MAG: Helix-turn-helix domain [Clostridiaceae bacterium]|jgi:transcriptional regulator with XRE-family HTH domain|nr:Helix-turn-helix domain [Clostridiaceae bacterium]